MSTARAVLAVTASGFAVVGLADVVLRLICDCVQCYWTCRSASELIPNLLRGLLSLNNIVTNVRIYLDDYSRSLFALQDGKVILDFRAILEDCKRELAKLKVTAVSLKYASTDPWHTRLWRSVSYGCHSESIEKSRVDLERLKLSLNLALSVTGRQNDIALRRAVGSTHEAVETAQGGIRTLSQQNESGFRDINAAIRTTQNAIQDGVVTLNHDIQGVETTVTTSTGQIREDIMHARTLSDVQYSNVTTTLTNMSAVVDRGYQLQQTLLQQQHTSERRILESMENAKDLEDFSATSTDDEEMEASSINLQALARPLCLVQDEFQRALDSCVKDGIMDVTIEESAWILTEYKKLLAASYTDAARSLNHPANLPGARASKTFATSSKRVKRQIPKTPIEDTTAPASPPPTASTQLMTLRHNHRTVFPTPIGTLVILSDKLNGHSNSMSTSFRFVFSPNPEISAVGLSAKLTRTWNALQGYTIQQYIRPSHVMRHYDIINNLLVEDDVAGVQALFSAGEATPFDCNEKGWSILDYAAWRQAHQVYKFLLEQGAGNDTLYPRSADVAALSEFQPEADSEASKCFQILKLINDKRLSSMWGRGGSLFHDLAYFDGRWDFDCLPFEEIIDKLLDRREEIDARDETGCTPLLNACYLGCTPTFVELLLRKGADVNALDTGGWNALHQVLFNISRVHERYGHGWGVAEREDYNAFETLKVLLSAGCSLDVATKDGQSYDEFAKFKEVKNIWNDALYEADFPREAFLRIRSEVPMRYAIVASSAKWRVAKNNEPSLEQRDQLF